MYFYDRSVIHTVLLQERYSITNLDCCQKLLPGIGGVVGSDESRIELLKDKPSDNKFLN